MNWRSALYTTHYATISFHSEIVFYAVIHDAGKWAKESKKIVEAAYLKSNFFLQSQKRMNALRPFFSLTDPSCVIRMTW